MSNTICDPLLRSLDQIREILSPAARKSLDALIQIEQLCGGKSISEIGKEIKKVVEKERKSLPKIISRTEALFVGSSNETPGVLLADVVRLSAGDKKKLGTHYGFELSQQKDEANKELQRWIESKGQVRPASAEERAVNNLGDLLPRIGSLFSSQTVEGLQEVIEIVNTVKKQFGVNELHVIFKTMNYRPTGKTKAQLHKELVQIVENAIVSLGQAEGIRDM